MKATLPLDAIAAPEAAGHATKADLTLSDRMMQPLFRFWSISIVSCVAFIVFQVFVDNNPYLWWECLLISVFYTIGISEGLTRLILFLRQRFPRMKDTARRLVLQAPLVFIYVLLFKAFGSWVESAVWGSGMSFVEEFRQGVAVALAVSIVVVVVYEAAFFFDEWRRSAIQAERLAAQNAVSQLEALKQQVDPHFLFNSLNTLAALIGENPPAQRFLDQLCDVYRYVLLSKDRSTVPLTEELAFVNSYIYLNQIRHRNNLQFENHLPEPAMGQVPPLALQLLVENALKHNVATPYQPLTIRLWQPDPQTVAVTNNLQPRNSFLPSTKQGLSNLQNRYALLSEQQVQIVPSNSQFEVRVPVLNEMK